MYSLEKIKKQLAEIINQSLESVLIQPDDFVYPPDRKMGDLSLPMFGLAKHFNQQPAQVARTVVDKILPQLADMAVVNMAGPYVNFKLQAFTENVLHEVDDHYGQFASNGKKVMIEYSNVNTHKEYHVGHLRNLCYGDSVGKILAAGGLSILPVSYINDFGIHAAKTVWQYLSGKTVVDKNNPGKSLGEMYVVACERLENNEHAKQAVSEVMKQIEARRGREYRAWKQTRKWSIDYFAKVYEKLKINFSHIYYESEYIDKGIKLVKKLQSDKLLVQSNGAVLADLENDDLSVLVFLRSDGTALYPVADLALAADKFKKGIDESIYVVDNRQTLYFKQLFRVLELVGYKQKMTHLPYDFVKLPSGMMSSRSGNTISFWDAYHKVLEKIKTETLARHADWMTDRLEEVANLVTVSVLKFEMVKVSANKIINFDIEAASRFDGFTAVYLQYTCARINSIMRKTKLHLSIADFNKLDHDKEKALIMQIAKYPEVVKMAGLAHQPAEVAKYVFELAQLFNDYYHEVQILSEKEEIKQARLELIMSVRQVMQNGLGLLGIEIVDEM
jgi:arginyl-tRNA synthetase